MNTTPTRSLSAHVDATAVGTPSRRSGLYESVGDFIAVTSLYADMGAPIERFEPSAGNEWLSAGYAAAIAYRRDSSSPDQEAPFMLATYVEGDVTYYRFTRFEDATRAGRYWAIGLD